MGDPLSALKPDTTYYVRLVATNPYGSGKGADVTFTTAPEPPVPLHETVGVFKIALGARRGPHGQLLVRHIYVGGVP
jgi:hypothetical protein